MKLYGKTMALVTAAFALPLFAAGAQDATHLQPVRASLMHKLDANKVHTGDEVRAKLGSTARLADGTKLPAGTILVGHVVQDDMQNHAKSELALRFDQADLKDGKVVPVKAMLVGVSQPVYEAGTLHYVWSPGTRQVDQIDALPGVDLHSRVASKNSGVFVSSKGDVKLNDASQLEFAIGPQSGA